MSSIDDTPLLYRTLRVRYARGKFINGRMGADTVEVVTAESCFIPGSLPPPSPSLPLPPHFPLPHSGQPPLALSPARELARPRPASLFRLCRPRLLLRAGPLCRGLVPCDRQQLGRRLTVRLPVARGPGPGRVSALARRVFGSPRARPHAARRAAPAGRPMGGSSPPPARGRRAPPLRRSSARRRRAPLRHSCRCSAHARDTRRWWRRQWPQQCQRRRRSGGRGLGTLAAGGHDGRRRTERGARMGGACPKHRARAYPTGGA